nr:immunoglobulin heavy chain junction region [Mus musculus]
CARDPGFAYW